jgi:hypothetical protein
MGIQGWCLIFLGCGAWWKADGGYAGIWRVEVCRGLGGLIGGDRLGYGYGDG